MFSLLSRILMRGPVTQKILFPELEEEARGLPAFAPHSSVSEVEWLRLQKICPTGAITTRAACGIATPAGQDCFVPAIDLGKCIACGLCPGQGPIVASRLTTTATRSREDLIQFPETRNISSSKNKGRGIFARSFSIRVVSTGCSACDLEVAAAFNPIFDLERFGVNLVASPRMADALVVTGPCATGMHEAVRRTYEAMPEPRLVIAAGTCAISGGVHAGGYTNANGVSSILPVDIFVPGCPPHPWSIIYGILLAMDRVNQP